MDTIIYILYIALLASSFLATYFLYKKYSTTQRECDKFLQLYLEKDKELNKLQEKLQDEFFHVQSEIFHTIQEMARKTTITNNPPISHK